MWHNNFKYLKPKPHPLYKIFIQGLASSEWTKWTKRRRLLNPAFHTEKLKSMLPAFDLCCHEMIIKWMEMVGDGRNSLEQADYAFKAMQAVYVPGFRYLPTKRI
ncbi:hypothetical protein POM88_012427 [Heracleum sosnowskyi]|uniref:Uncharacterized protein n=1 Tax=Heracleum sosnowskyi TaxID=360622 RepID=A0AAD8IZ16_9APIA|nr:hypothetical protein POM88_012427 [Heracleum sosnowskyi]